MPFSIKELLLASINSGASDVHLSVGEKPMFRIDGELKPVPNAEPVGSADMERSVRELLTPEQKARYEEQREFDISFSLATNIKEQRFRANFFYEKGAPAVALRLITANIRTIKQLELPEELRAVTKLNNGLFLVTGPTGSGKSTTLAAMIQEINLTRQVHIITIEDPIEYLYSSELALIHQREIGRDTKNFANALRGAMREDPDVILIGEMRDLETIAAAVTAAETGHLVFGTLHTRDAAQSIDRIIDVFPPHQQRQICVQLSLVLIGVLSQQLIPLSSSRGRTVATEYLIATNAVRNCIRDGKSSQIKNTIQTGSSLGMHTMDQDLARLCKSGVISKEAALMRAYDVDMFNRYLS
ncbi:MAG: type IV pilus twitching motility protein PilT [Synergistes sp.]|nr:type IV pilus twitching motility protein PilT [Synergistes sp.]